MRAYEDYTPHITLALGLTVVILVVFQLYIFREPDRISGVEAQDKAIAESAGQALFTKNCTLCHGDNGEGTPGRPSLNDKQFLDSTSDDTIFSIISSGVPNTQMPAWNQSHGGPLTDEDVRNLVAFIRAWQPTAPDRSNMPPVGDLTKGRSLYASVCAVCHGDQGQGTSQVPPLNDPVHLSQFDNTWYREAISKGLPAKGMPTWGTVLSPQQISDVISVFDFWRRQAGIVTPTPQPTETPESTATPGSQ